MDMSGTSEAKPHPKNPMGFHHGNLPVAIREAVRGILASGDIEQLKVRELTRIAGVSPSAFYCHFTSREDLLATVSAEGFRELAGALRAATDNPEPLLAVGLAYVEFAKSNPGLFGLMFGSQLTRRESHSDLDAAAEGVLETLASSGLFDREPGMDRVHALAAWSIIHGLSVLTIGNILPPAEVSFAVRHILNKYQSGV